MNVSVGQFISTRLYGCEQEWTHTNNTVPMVSVHFIQGRETLEDRIEFHIQSLLHMLYLSGPGRSTERRLC